MASCTERIDATLSAVRGLDPKLRAFISVFEEHARNRAAEIDSTPSAGRGPLYGAAVAVKDNICTDIGATTCASKMLRDYHSPFNAHVIDNLRDAGAVIVGKTNLDEFAMGSSTENSGLFPTLNPWDPKRVPGGSSGGSAVAVAARLTPYALGSETGGSIRQPASFCGVSGLKPSYGRVSRYGLVAFASSLDQIGPIAVDARGLAEVMNVISGRDARDSTSVDAAVPDYVARLDEPVGDARIGVAAEYFGEGLHPETRRAVEAAIETYRRLGADIREIHLPHAPYTIACYYLVCTAEASSNLARFDGVRYGLRADKPMDHIDLYSASREIGLGHEVKRRIMLGTFALTSGYYDAYYLKALKVRTLIRNDFVEAFRTCDVILSPTTPTPAFKLGEKSDNPLEMYLADIYNCAANLAGLPAVSIPCGFTTDRLPVGLQLTAPAFAEDRLLQIAHWYQQATDHHLQKPPICAE